MRRLIAYYQLGDGELPLFDHPLGPLGRKPVYLWEGQPRTAWERILSGNPAQIRASGKWDPVSSDNKRILVKLTEWDNTHTFGDFLRGAARKAPLGAGTMTVIIRTAHVSFMHFGLIYAQPSFLDLYTGGPPRGFEWACPTRA